MVLSRLFANTGCCMPSVNRREFLGTSAVGIGLAALQSGVFAANEGAKAEVAPVRMAVMGVNGRGKGLLSGFCGFPQVEIAYICDPDADVIPDAVKIVTDKGKKIPKVEKDFRTALDDQDVNVLVCAAPDHWHALATVWGCQAGKDVYTEKPVAHNPTEGRRMVEAARRYNRVVGAGTQRRSAPHIQDAIKLIHEGKLGDLAFVRSWITSQRPNIGKDQITSPPQNLDFDLWCGPAPNNGYKKNLVHYHWHWRWDYGTGECGNNGIHFMDVARWGAGVEYPEHVASGGGKYVFDDDQETPDTLLSTFDFGDLAIQWEHRTWSPRGLEGDSSGVEFYGSEASLLIDGKGWTMFGLEKDKKKKEIVLAQGEPKDHEKPHLQNFLDCLVSRNKTNADIETAHRSTLLCQLANISWRTRSTLKFDGKTESIVGNDAATALMSRSYRKGFELPVIS
jgi:predicted dehydrogenase